MERFVLFGAGTAGKQIMDFIKFCKLESYVYAFCDNDPSKEGSTYCGISVISYVKSKELNLPYVISVSERFFNEIETLLTNDGMTFYTDIIKCLHNECKLDLTKLNRDYCAFYHVDSMDHYFDAAEIMMDQFWGEKSSFPHFFNQLDLDSVIELACGRGRHVERYIDRANKVVLVDILEKNIELCKERFKDRDNVVYYKNNGYDLSDLKDEEYSALFTYDAMVHFELFDIYNYLLETYRVLKRGGKALFHHSNLMLSYNQSFRNPHNPDGRNFMSKELFAYLAYKAGFEIVEQKIINWSTPASDCITLVKKP